MADEETDRTGKLERTLVAIKPDGINRCLIGEIISRFEKRGFKLVGMKFAKPHGDMLDKFYKDHVGKFFYEGLKSFMEGGPVIAMVWQGVDVILQCRGMLGETSPLKSPPGTIRGDLCLDMGRNLIHGSDASSLDTADNEIALWFKPEEIFDWTPTLQGMVYEHDH